MKNIKISLFGSSIVEGTLGASAPEKRWYNILHNKLSNRFPSINFPIYNGGEGGKSTRELMAFYKKSVLDFNPDYLLLMPGWNNKDLNRPERIVEIDEFRDLTVKMIDSLPATSRTILILMQPCKSEWHFCHSQEIYQDAFKKAGVPGLDELSEPYRVAVRELANERNLPMIDLFSLMQNEVEQCILRGDGIHLTDYGHKLFAQAAFEELERHIADS
ncbi:MAG: hypothetical protein GX811_00095 [Lentisphaerae bacterium]|nr:hypothetical protein [Lentisphaerota bacterium]